MNDTSNIRANTQAAEILAEKVVDAAVESSQFPSMSTATQEDTKKAIVKETEKIVMYQMNQEPWYQSGILVTQYVTMFVTLAGVFGYVIEPELRDEIIAAILAIGGVVTPIVTVYLRIFKKKPFTLFSNLFGKGE